MKKCIIKGSDPLMMQVFYCHYCFGWEIGERINDCPLTPLTLNLKL